MIYIWNIYSSMNYNNKYIYMKKFSFDLSLISLKNMIFILEEEDQLIIHWLYIIIIILFFLYIYKLISIFSWYEKGIEIERRFAGYSN